MQKHVWQKVLFCLLLLGVGFAMGYGAKPSEIVSAKSLRENTNQFKFIRPLLAVTRDSDAPSPQYINLLKKTEDYINLANKSDLLDDASVYFIDYGKNAGSFSLNADTKYNPASLIKVVIMMAFLKQSESDPNILKKSLVYNSKPENTTDSIPFEAPSTLKVGEKYSVSDLINSMIIDSDNGARDLLLPNINLDYFNNVYTNLGLETPENVPNHLISAKDYSLFLRVLFNSTYLNEENSEKALSILSQAKFADGLVAGLPKGTVIAHKYGEYANSSDYQIDSMELHDCGIIYLPNNPYLLCVMTRGKDLKYLQNVIASISKIVYDAVH